MAISTKALVIGLIIGLVIGGASGWLAKPIERVAERKTVTETISGPTVTVTKTLMPTPTPTPTPTPELQWHLEGVYRIESGVQTGGKFDLPNAEKVRFTFDVTPTSPDGVYVLVFRVNQEGKTIMEYQENLTDFEVTLEAKVSGKFSIWILMYYGYATLTVEWLG